MKKATSKATEANDMRPEYDFHGAVRGKHYKPLHEGYSVHIHRRDGTTEVKQYVLAEGTVMLQPDVREYFPDSDSVNSALRSLVALMAKMPRKAIGKKKRQSLKPAALDRGHTRPAGV